MTKLICKKCGVISEGDYLYCPYCGDSYNVKNSKGESSDPKKQVAPGNKAQEIYKKYKEERPESILFIQTGYFYSVYFEDAERCCELLGWQLNPQAKNFSLTGCPIRAFPSVAEKLESLNIPYILINQSDYENLIYREVADCYEPEKELKHVKEKSVTDDITTAEDVIIKSGKIPF